MSLFLLCSLGLLFSFLAVIAGAVIALEMVLARGSNNQLALVPVAPTSLSAVQPAPYDPLEASSWHIGMRAHIRYLARSIHVPPDLDSGMPEELHCRLQVLAMLQDLFRSGQLHRPTVVPSDTQVDNQNR